MAAAQPRGPPPTVNQIEVLNYITKDMLRQTKNNLQFLRNIGGEDVAGRFTETPKVGETFKVRKPTRYQGRRGEVFTPEAYRERYVTMEVQETFGVDLELTNRELMFQLDNISERVVKPASETLANMLESALLRIATQSVANTVGTAGTVPTALKTYNSARALMSWEAAPQNGHSLLVSPDMSVEAVEAGKSFFNPSSEIERQYENGVLGRHAGAKVYEVQNLYVHTYGVQGGASPVSNGADQTGFEINIDGLSNSITGWGKKGDIVTFAGVKAVNPWTREHHNSLRQFVLTEDVDSNGSGEAALKISPAIVTSGPFQNVSGPVVDGSAVVVGGGVSAVSPQGLRFHREAFLWGSFDQPEPTGAVEFCKMMTDPQTGLKVRLIRDWDTKQNKQITRADVVVAFGVAFSEFAARVQS